MEKGTTDRGFSYQEFEDCNGRKCSIQMSSSALEDRIWFGANKIGLKKFTPATGWKEVELEQTKTVHHIANNRMHLNRKQVWRLLPTLIKFAFTGRI